MFINAASFFDRKNIKGFLQGHIRELKKDFGTLPPYILEQVAWRMEQVKKNSPECYKNMVCKHCGCEFPSKAFEDRPCDGRCYKEMMNEKQWKEFKLTNNIKF